MRALDLSGQRFGRLQPIERESSNKNGVQWLALCDCGNLTVAAAKKIKSGHTTSCGCARRDAAGQVGKANTVHGHCSNGGLTRTYNSWQAMRRRCNDPADEHYADYGARGITVCDRWEGFAAFLADVGERPEGMTLDRYPDNDGGYEPDNVRWATPAEQANNRRNNVERS